MTPATEVWLQHVCEARSRHTLPPRADAAAREFVSGALALLFPHLAADRRCDASSVRAELDDLHVQLTTFVALKGNGDAAARDVAARFLDSLPAIHGALLLDADATYEADPAAASLDEVILAYPGFYALACYRIAHELVELGVDLLPRLVTELAHHRTGIDIHPAAHLGRSIAIDHGTGIVVGETTVIGDRVRLYQGVTLGALSVSKALASTKRHPTIEDDVVIYANATVLGGQTVVGHSSIIGGNVWLTHSVPPRSVVTHVAPVERVPADWDGLEFHI